MGRRQNCMEHARKRSQLVNSLSRTGATEKILTAIQKVPRHLFVPEVQVNSAYVDTPLPIGHGQTISAPHMVALMCSLLELKEGHKVLEIGTGSGYNAAVMAELVGKGGRIYSIECLEPLVRFAQANLKKAGCNNVEVIHRDGSLGYEQEAPYDRICVTACAPALPQSLIVQLKAGGLIVIPEGDTYQRLYLYRKRKDSSMAREDWGGVFFVPLVGRYGFNYVTQP
jgi:protein-L-isoaspartate(D-aspartate) O-methyltransferase